MNWLLLDSGSCAPAFNMALDEALLEAMPRLQKPVLRFYGWTEPAASFGYFQKISEVESATLLRPLVRRPTGGGIVPHDADWTYSVAFPTNHEWYSFKATESYERVHEWIRSAFAKLNVATELASCCKKLPIADSRLPIPSACFTGYEKSDVLWHGKKIAGAAQRRTREGLLIQGSVQPPPVSLKRVDWENAMCAVGRLALKMETEFLPDEPLVAKAEELIRQKYSSDAYNRKR